MFNIRQTWVHPISIGCDEDGASGGWHDGRGGRGGSRDRKVFGGGELVCHSFHKNTQPIDKEELARIYSEKGLI